MKLAQSLGLDPNFSLATPSPIDDAWAIGTGTSLAGNGLTAVRGFVAASGSRVLAGQSAGQALRGLSTEINVLGGVGVGYSAYQAYDAYSSGNTPSGALSTADALAGVAAFFPGPDVGALAYGLTRIALDIGAGTLTPTQPSILERAAALQVAGCL